MRTACLVLICSLLFGCERGQLPGTDVGTFHVQGLLVDNTCGNTGLPADDPLDFEVELRRLGTDRGLWILGKPPGTDGTLREDGSFVFVRESTYTAIEPQSMKDVIRNEEPADYWSGAVLNEQPNPGCTLAIEERVEGLLEFDATSDAAVLELGAGDSGTQGGAEGLAATNKITIAPALGSDCRAALAEQGGPFNAFPCTASYMLSADRIR